MSTPLESVDKALLFEIAERSRLKWQDGLHPHLERVFSKDLPKEELVRRISWLKDAFYPGSLQKVRQIYIGLFTKHIGSIPSYFDEHYHLNIRGIREVVEEIALKKKLLFPVYLLNYTHVRSFLASGAPFAGFVHVTPSPYGHYIPIFAQKNSETGKYSFVITDSLGKSDVIDDLYGLLDPPLIQEVYVSQVTRQSDRDSCGIFCIRDFSKWIDHIKSERRLFERLEPFVGGTSPFYTEIVSFKFLKDLPPEFLRSAQSVHKTSISKEEEDRRRHFYPSSAGHLINCKIERYHIKSILRILEKIF